MFEGRRRGSKLLVQVLGGFKFRGSSCAFSPETLKLYRTEPPYKALPPEP